MTIRNRPSDGSALFGWSMQTQLQLCGMTGSNRMTATGTSARIGSHWLTCSAVQGHTRRPHRPSAPVYRTVRFLTRDFYCNNSNTAKLPTAILLDAAMDCD